MESTGGYDHFASQLATVKSPGGIHDIFIRFKDGGFNLQSIEFLQTGRSAFMQIMAESFHASEKTTTRGEALCETQDGAWAKYEGLEFGAGADAFTVVYSADDKHEGGSISVRLDRVDAPPLCEIPVTSTGNWGTYIGRGGQIKRVTGRHDVFLTFSGNNKIAWAIADVKWLWFEEAVTATTPSGPKPANDRSKP